ncbi:MAG: hypothetical protein M3020_03545, partial [Myxococcota bacterium]|nr:hypothetical protein [Myxococcota bacterium]
MAAITEQGRYYSRSFEVDPLGTAEAVLRLRDSLVEAGWEGEAFVDGGSRLTAVQELEQLSHPVLPLGVADRLAAVDRTLAVAPRRVYAELTLAEASELWSARWQSIFRCLERGGTPLTRFAVHLPGAASGSDLAAIQAVLSSALQSSEAPAIRGDGSLIHITGETSWEAACAAAAVVAPLRSEEIVVIRSGDHAALDGALLGHGLRTQGLVSATPWRSAVQVLPLALELGFEPKDPYHVLELLTLPVGPFQGRVGHELARALGDAPGIGGRPWESAKAKLGADDSRTDRAASLRLVQEWLETRAADPTEGASKAALLAVVARVRAWILSRIAKAPEDIPLLSAAQHCSALSSALSSDPRQTLTLAEVRKLRASVLSASGAAEVAPEQAGRVEHVASAAGLWAPRRVVVWWSFNDQAPPSQRPPWRKPELLALNRAGLVLPDPQRRLAEHAAAARRALACATERVVLVSAGNAAGTSLGTHPLWDEIVARAGLDERSVSRLTVSCA